MEEILKGAMDGELGSLKKIYSLYKNQIYFFCLKLVADSEEAGSLCFETFDCAFSRLDTLEDPEQFEIWIKNIAAIKCFNYIHKMKPMLFLQAVGDTDEPLYSQSEMEAFQKGEIDESKTSNIMDEMLNRLNDAQRMTLMFHYYNALSVVQIAKIMSCSPDIVKQRMTKAADHMKNSIKALADNGVILSRVDFRTVLQLMAACITVPLAVSSQIEGLMLELSGNAPTPEEQPLDLQGKDYVLDNFNESRDEQPLGVMEEAALKYTGPVTPITSSVLDEFQKSHEPKPKKSVTENVKTIAKKSEESIVSRFKKLSMMQQSISLLVVVAIVAGVIIGVSFKKKKTNPDLKPVVASSVASSTVSSTESQVVVPVYKLEIKEEANSVKASDGVAIATATYQYPVATISENPDAQETINSFFNKEKKSVLATYTSEQKQAECQYMYSQKSYGAWQKNEIKVSVKAGRVDAAGINLLKTDYSYAYGNTHGETELSGYCFSPETGKELSVADIMKDESEYYSFASEYIANAVEEKQTNGEFALYNDYKSTISTILQKEHRWYLTDTGLTVIFNPDEIIYYSYGTMEIEIPYSELGNYLKDAFQK